MNFLFEAFRKAYFYLIPTQKKRTAWIIKHHYFAEIGDNFFFQPKKLPADPQFIKFHNNVVVAADVTFLCHDVIYLVTRNIDSRNNYEHMGCIEVMDNVFIGAGTTVLPDVRIGNNSIIAAGSIVTKDVPDGSVVAGVPARVIGSFDEMVAKRLREAIDTKTHYGRFTAERAEAEWLIFNRKRNMDDKTKK